jgi:hypothetical protein
MEKGRLAENYFSRVNHLANDPESPRIPDSKESLPFMVSATCVDSKENRNDPIISGLPKRVESSDLNWNSYANVEYRPGVSKPNDSLNPVKEELKNGPNKLRSSEIDVPNRPVRMFP